MLEINKIVRPSIRDLVPYSSAREEYKGAAEIFLDANESPFDTEFNRYPDPQQVELKTVLASKKGLKVDNVFVGNGSDEAIDLLIRSFCEPGEDKIYIFPPTYGMYTVSAKINNVQVVEMSLSSTLRLPPKDEIIAQLKGKGLVFFCHPNNPTGLLCPLDTIRDVAQNFAGLVVVDEAYIDFSTASSAITLLEHTHNVVVLQTMSKAYGLAGLRLGMAYAHPEIIEVLSKIKPPYNVNSYSQKVGLQYLNEEERHSKQIAQILMEKDRLVTALSALDLIKHIYPSETNFILVKCDRPKWVFQALRERGIIIRDRSDQIANCLRISIGTRIENDSLINTIKDIINEESIILR